jgi:hypothetical protein
MDSDNSQPGTRWYEISCTAEQMLQVMHDVNAPPPFRWEDRSRQNSAARNAMLVHWMAYSSSRTSNGHDQGETKVTNNRKNCLTLVWMFVLRCNARREERAVNCPWRCSAPAFSVTTSPDSAIPEGTWIPRLYQCNLALSRGVAVTAKVILRLKCPRER